jgi:hypothetical protein
MNDLKDFLASNPVGFRAPRFRDIAQGMLDAQRPVFIVETGCMRPNSIPEADGCSTLVWDFVAQKTGGHCISIDINPENCNYAKSKVSPATQIVCEDSVAWFARVKSMYRPIDFLYLDSMDYNGDNTNKGLSSLHHAAELCVAWKWLAPDALIAVDDCLLPYEGKHAMVKRFFDSIGVEPLTADYIHTWNRPSAQFSLTLPSTRFDATHTPLAESLP